MLNLAVEHEFRLGGGGTITPRLNVNWQGDYEWAAETESWTESDPKSSCHQDSYTVVDARVTFKPSNGDWFIAAFGGNITDERYLEFCEADRSSWLIRYGRPSWYGVEFTAHCGRNYIPTALMFARSTAPLRRCRVVSVRMIFPLYRRSRE